MKKNLSLMALCSLLLHPVTGQSKVLDICSPLHVDALSSAHHQSALRDIIAEAIATLDNAKIEFPSPSLASGKINYVTISPDFSDKLNEVCILGYFEHSVDHSTARLQIDHIENIKLADPKNPEHAVNSTRIFFRTPFRHEFEGVKIAESRWQFWERHQAVELKLAAFKYQDGQRTQVYFGHALDTSISDMQSSVFAAFLFAALCYCIAAFAVPLPAQFNAIPFKQRLGNTFRKLRPWQITGVAGKASLSQLQMLLFTLIVATLLFYQWLRTGVLQEISSDLLYLIGISTVGAGASRITDSIKLSLDPECYEYAQSLGWFTASLAGSKSLARLSDLLLTNKRFDIYKFQMLVFTLVIAAYVAASGANELANVQISTTLLTLMGMSQGAYMGGKASADTLSPLQDQLRGMLKLQQQFLMSEDMDLKKLLKARYTLAAFQAADMFGNIFARDIPKHMLAMPMLVERQINTSA